MSEQPDVISVGRQVTERFVAESVVAAVAARAAAHTPGVVRLEPGLAGLLRQVGRAAGRLAGFTAAETAGVDVRYDGDIPVIHLDVVVAGDRQAAAVGAAVQRSVTDAVVADTGVPAPVVSVSILDIDVDARTPARW